MSFGYTGAQRQREEELARERAEEEGKEFVPLRDGGGVSNEFWGKIDFLQVLALAGIMKLSKTPEGLKVLERIGIEFTKGIFKTLSFLGQASAANPVAAWANPILISGVLERFGFLPPRFNANFHLGVTVISGVDIYSDILKDIADALPWNLIKGAPAPQYPQAITFAGEMGQMGFSPSEIADYAKAIQPRAAAEKVVKKK